jgi:MoaA/NifB/PqqE/SkfB family radical SAM enzyme
MLPYDSYVAGLERLLARHRFGYVALSGGEPLLYPQLDSLVTFLSRVGQRTILTSNGRMLTRQRLAGLAIAGLDALQIPLLAASPGLHDRLAGRPSWDGAVRALALGLEGGVAVSATFIATAANTHELPLVAELLDAIGVRSLVVNEMHPEGSARDHPGLAADPSTVRRAMARARELTTGSRLRISFISAQVDSSQQEQPRPWDRLTVTSDGDVKLCNQSVLTLGSLPQFADDALDQLLSDLIAGEAQGYRGRVDRCRCFDSRYGPPDRGEQPGGDGGRALVH